MFSESFRFFVPIIAIFAALFCLEVAPSAIADGGLPCAGDSRADARHLEAAILESSAILFRALSFALVA